MKILVTGCAGFIGFHLAHRLLQSGHEVVGIDDINDYYSVKLKIDRLNILKEIKGFGFYLNDISDEIQLNKIFKIEKPKCVINLAAQAGVRYSLKNPKKYLQSNVMGFGAILEAAKDSSVDHLIYASSSSVYGLNKKIPFDTSDNVDNPASLYAATKKSNELMAHTYSHLYGLPTTGLRFFTVYGPWGRPDMAPWLFTSSIIEKKPIDVFNYGDMMRDFTYIDDILDGIVGVMGLIPGKGLGNDCAPYKIYNIGNNKPEKLMNFIDVLEKAIGIKAIINYKPMQMGDVKITYACIDELVADIGFNPSYSITEGIDRWVSWYRSYHKV